MKYSGEFFDSSMFLLRYTAITAKLKNNKEKKKEIIANKDVQPGTCIMPKILKNTVHPFQIFCLFFRNYMKNFRMR